jgi:hypothetical protein
MRLLLRLPLMRMLLLLLRHHGDPEVSFFFEPSPAPLRGLGGGDE